MNNYVNFLTFIPSSLIYFFLSNSLFWTKSRKFEYISFIHVNINNKLWFWRYLWIILRRRKFKPIDLFWQIYFIIVCIILLLKTLIQWLVHILFPKLWITLWCIIHSYTILIPLFTSCFIFLLYTHLQSFLFSFFLFLFLFCNLFSFIHLLFPCIYWSLSWFEHIRLNICRWNSWLW